MRLVTTDRFEAADINRIRKRDEPIDKLGIKGEELVIHDNYCIIARIPNNRSVNSLEYIQWERTYQNI